jgi:hypothetical protein
MRRLLLVMAHEVKYTGGDVPRENATSSGLPPPSSLAVVGGDGGRIYWRMEQDTIIFRELLWTSLFKNYTYLQAVNLIN